MDLFRVVADSEKLLFLANGIKTIGGQLVENHLVLSYGSFPRGLVKLGDYDFVYVIVAFSPNSPYHFDKRSFQVVFYKSSPIYLQQKTGQMNFPVDFNKNPVFDKLEFQAGKHFADQLIMLNFTRLPTNASNKVTVDGVPVNTTSHTMFLQSIHAPSITITLDMPQKEVITFHYWIVSGKCSEQLLNKSKKQWIIYLCQKH